MDDRTKKRKKIPKQTKKFKINELVDLRLKKKQDSYLY